MARRHFRTSIALAFALIFTLTVATTALAVTYWNSGCWQFTNVVCVFRDTGFSGPQGHWVGSNSSYVGQNYPGSSVTVNDTVTGAKNKYTSRDVRFWTNTNFGGSYYCVDSDSDVGNFWWSGFNDVFSSHQVMSNDSYC